MASSRGLLRDAPRVDLLLAEWRFINRPPDFAHVPRGRFAKRNCAILVDQHKHEPMRAEPFAQRCLSRGVGVGDDNDIAFNERRDVRAQIVHLFDVSRIKGRVGKHNDGPRTPEKIVQIYL